MTESVLDGAVEKKKVKPCHDLEYSALTFRSPPKSCNSYSSSKSSSAHISARQKDLVRLPPKGWDITHLTTLSVNHLMDITESSFAEKFLHQTFRGQVAYGNCSSHLESIGAEDV